MKFYKIYLLFLVLIISVQCNKPNFSKYRQERIAIGIFFHGLLPSLSEPPPAPPDDTFVDNKDGTISLYDEETYEFVNFKKCLQGQIYRIEQNDCQGTGDSSDNYGANLLSYCNTDDNSCNETKNYTLISTDSSQIYLSCKNDTLNNKTWRVIDLSYLTSMLKETEFDSFYAEYPRNGHCWTNKASSSDSGQAYYVSYIYGSQTGRKTLTKYLLCMESK
ncbi:MAG: hypothetical protein KDK90_27125 [Leptospiraceae bacterium]|nr:hypothetical protein [Leptospiraceae bacterium]